MDKHKLQAYWRTNLKYLIVLTLIWFIVGLLFPVLIYQDLNQIRIGGFPLGFWFGMQGAVMVFVILLFVYAWLMNRLDKKYGLED